MSSRRRVCLVSVKLEVNKYRDREWLEWNELHRVDGGPAVEYTDGYRAWWERGVRHRIGLPAVEYASGYREWWERGRLIRSERR